MQNAVKIFLGAALAGMLLVSPAQANQLSSIEAQHIEMAKEYMANRQWDYAGYEWRAALAANPKSYVANAGLAQMLLNAGYTKEAIRHLEAVRKYMDRLSIELLYGKALEQKGDYLKAEKVYLRNLQRVPHEGYSFARLQEIISHLPADEQKKLKQFLDQKAVASAKMARQALESDNFKKAVKYFNISTRHKPAISDLNDYGVALLLLGKYDQAIEQFNRLQKAQSAQWQFHANAAYVLLGKGQSVAAAKNMEKAISLCNDDLQKSQLYNGLGFIYENQRKWHNARNAYEHAIALNPALEKARMNLAYAYQKDMAYEKAIDVYHEILKRDSQNDKAWNRLGFVYELAHEEKRAVKAYRKAIELFPQEQEGYYNLAILYRKMGKTRQADAQYKKLMEIEFSKIEAGKNNERVSELAKRKQRDPHARLLDYVDLFLSQST